MTLKAMKRSLWRSASASGEMFWFMILFFNLLLSYCVAFYLCFGMDVAAFSSVAG